MILTLTESQVTDGEVKQAIMERKLVSFAKLRSWPQEEWIRNSGLTILQSVQKLKTTWSLSVEKHSYVSLLCCILLRINSH